MEEQNSLAQIAHELRGSLHTMELALRLLEDDQTGDAAEMVAILKQEIAKVKKNISKLIDSTETLTK